MKILRCILCMIFILTFTFTSVVSAEEVVEENTEFIEETGVELSTEEHKSGELIIDNTHVYENMTQSYSDGYEPQIVEGEAVIVLPLCYNGSNPPEKIRGKVDLGDVSSAPFEIKNYEQTIIHAVHKASDGTENKIYLAQFRLKLKAGRLNGSYPVTVILQGDEIYSEFTVYVNITDGIYPNAQEAEPVAEIPTEEEVILMPKLIISSVSGNKVKASETAKIKITLKNTSHTEKLQNLTVTALAESEFLLLKSETDTNYFEETDADEEFKVTYNYQVRNDAPSGQINIPLQFDYAYGKGMSGSGTATVRLYVEQYADVQFPEIAFPSEVVVSDTVELPVQAINLGRASVKNVRAEIEGDGLLPNGTAFLGEVAGNSSVTQPLEVQITGKSGESSYGETNGVVTFYYTDDTGNEYSQTQEFSFTIKSPFSDAPKEEIQAEPHNWIWIISAIGAVIAGLAVYLVYRYRKRKSV